MQPPFLTDDHRRSTIAERLALVRERFGVELVDGFYHPAPDHSRAQRQDGVVVADLGRRMMLNG